MAFTAEEAFQFLEQSRAKRRLAHAYLITCTEADTARQAATRMAGIITGQQENPLIHPDVHVLEPESKSRIISVAQIREKEYQFQMSSHAGGAKIGILFDADRLNESASNAFLKTLEEPPKDTHFLLTTSNADHLLETIISRCIEVPIRASQHSEPSPLQARLLSELQAFSKIPAPILPQVFLLVRSFQSLLTEAKTGFVTACEEAMKTEQKLYKQSSGATSDWFDSRQAHFAALAESRYRRERATLIETLEQWWGDVLRQQHGGESLDHPAFFKETMQLAQRLPTSQILKRIDAMSALRENSNSNVQEQLALETAFIQAFLS